MILKNVDTLLREYYDLSDVDTLHALAEATSKANHTQMLSALSHKLYEKIQEKYEKIDFSSVSRSRGDITKIEKYDSLVECIDIIHKLVTEYNENTMPVDILITAIANIKNRTDGFKRAFVINSPLMIMTYNTIVLGIVESVSFLIATCIEYVKNPGSETFQMALDTVAYNNTRSNLMFESLYSFNDSIKSGEFDEAMKYALEKTKVRVESATTDVKYDNPFMSNEDDETDDSEVVVHDDSAEDDSNLIDDLLDDDDDDIDDTEDEVVEEKFNISDDMIAGGSFWGTRVGYFVLKLLIPIIRSITYHIFSFKQKRSDYYANMAELLQMNAYQLQYNNTIDDDKKKKIFNKQMELVDKYKDKANRWSIDYKKADKEAEGMINSEARKYRTSDLSSTSDVESVLF